MYVITNSGWSTDHSPNTITFQARSRFHDHTKKSLSLLLDGLPIWQTLFRNAIVCYFFLENDYQTRELFLEPWEVLPLYNKFG